jgi:hypothetical protein
MLEEKNNKRRKEEEEVLVEYRRCKKPKQTGICLNH